jgi:hypothetical protein
MLDRRTLLFVTRARVDADAITAWITSEMAELRAETALARKELASARAELRRWQELARAKGTERAIDALLN